jgi:hypothetical protein
MASADNQVALRIGQAFELDTNRLTHGRVGAVSAEQVAPPHRHRAGWCLDADLHATGILRHGADAVGEIYRGLGQRIQFVVKNRGQLALFALDAERVIRIVGQHTIVEHGNYARSTIAKLVPIHPQPDAHQLVHDPDGLQHLKRGRVKRRRA